MTFQNRQNYRDRNQISGYRDWEEGKTEKQAKETLIQWKYTIT